MSEGIANPERIRVHKLCGTAHSVLDMLCPPEALRASLNDRRERKAPEPTYSLYRLTGEDMDAIVTGLWDTIHYNDLEEQDPVVQERAQKVLQIIRETTDYPNPG